MAKKILIGFAILALIIIVGAGIYYVFHTKPAASKNDSHSAANTAVTKTETSAHATSTQNNITYTNDGFKPSSITVKSGDKITVINSSNRDLEFESGPHPTHNENSELNLGEIKPGEQAAVTVTKTGTFDVHNHLNPSDQMEVIVK